MSAFRRFQMQCMCGLALAIATLMAAQAAAAGEIVVLNGPNADAWRQALSQRARVSDIRSIDRVPQDATVIIPDRLLTKAELERLKALPPSVRVLALGRSAYSDNGSSAAQVLGVGKHFQYIPLLYPAWLDYNMEKYEQIARWAAEQGAQGMGVFSYTHTLPERANNRNFEVIRDVFAKYESWKPQRVLDNPRSPGLKPTPLVLFMHKNDTLRVGPEEAVEWAQKLNANTISVEVSRVRTRSIYPSRFTIEGEHEFQGRKIKVENDLDYLPRLLAAADKAGIAVHANIMTKQSPLETRPDERQVMSSDFDSGQEPKREAPCPISGARHYDDMGLIVEELLTKYPQIAAIELDEPRIYNQGWVDWACFCKGCGEAFKERYGYELTPANVIIYPQFEDDEPAERRKHTTKGGRQQINAEFQEFRTWLMNELVIEKFRRAINRVKPDTALVVWQPRTYEAFGFSPGSINYGVSVFGPEYMDGPGSPRYLNHPDAFVPRVERIVRVVDARGGEGYSLDAEIFRVDRYHKAEPLLWGESEDRSRWVLMSSARDGQLLYVAFDPLRDGTATRVLDRVFEWIAN